MVPPPSAGHSGPSRSISEAATELAALADRWRNSTLGEKQAFQSWFTELCAALGVDRPGPNHGDAYCFEKPIRVLRPDGSDGQGFIDCWKAGHVAIEAKATGSAGTNDVPLRKAFKQLSDYVSAEPGTIPPYLMVVDVPRELIVWEGWGKPFGGFAAGRRIALDTLASRPGDIALLQDILSRPAVRDTRGKAQQVTRDIAGKLAQLSATFEGRGFAPERVARFLMRCVFCFFAEDVGLLPKELFKRTLQTARGSGDGEHVAMVLTELWRKMDTGGMFGADLIDRFNGHFFQSVEALPLESADITLLIDAAGFDWSAVEPSIFGTLLVRALEPAERHKLGAEYTPREYIERLVEPTVVEPLRERWTAVQARVTQLEESGKKKDQKAALQEVMDFHEWLRGLRFLDPACGSGNFLYVTMAAVKRIELEVLREVARLSGGQEGLVLDEVHPRQFHGIEVNWWAREIAELTLWIGYHQFWREAHGGRTPPVPILEDTGTIECRDAILAWDEIVHRPEKDRPDPTPRIVHPVTGELVPDPEAKLPYMEYVGARQAEWPEADFIVGNPPYIGEKRQRDALGDGYVDALRSAYPDHSRTADLVTYWWRRAHRQTTRGQARRAGLITTNSIVQSQNRQVLTDGLRSGGRLIWVVPDHPWVEGSEGAAVRVAMMVIGAEAGPSKHVTWTNAGSELKASLVSHINADLTVGSDVATASGVSLLANRGICWQGYKLVGAGFLLEPTECADLIARAPEEANLLKQWWAGRDLTSRPRKLCVIDFALMSLGEARAFPVLLNLVQSRVKPERDNNRRATRRDTWWRFGEPQPSLRRSTILLPRLIVTSEVAKHRMFAFVEAGSAFDGSIVCVASESAWMLGVLSSAAHEAWTLASSGRLEDRPRYTRTRAFSAFPFADTSAEVLNRLGDVAERLDAHRKNALARADSVTMTGMYNVVEKLRSGEALTPKERKIHEIAACGILKDLHDELDALVAEAYGWPWPMEREAILERLVALHDERVEEEKRGIIRWLRPEYQIPRFAPEGTAAELELDEGEAEPDDETIVALLPWPATAVEQLEALSALVARKRVTVEAACDAFEGADSKLVARHLETLAMLGEVAEEDGWYGVAGRGG